MPQLCASRALLETAQRSGEAVAALNFYNAETLLAHIGAAKSLKSSIILQTTESTINYLGMRMIVGMAAAVAEEIEQPIALHLDHGGSYDLAARCIDHGYTSVMIDGSKLSFADNCELTRRVAELAHSNDVSVEGELGHITHNDEMLANDITKFYTRAEDAARFVNETNVDALAVAVGTAHGFYRGAVRLDFDRLTQIKSAVGSTALVLHGGSGVPKEAIRRAIECGIAKINFGTELKDAFTRGVKQSLCESNEIDLRKTFLPAIDAVKKVSMEKINLCRGYE
jgi:tagatose 1,6-diphosphate aldolase GatY/KbaY